MSLRKWQRQGVRTLRTPLAPKLKAKKKTPREIQLEEEARKDRELRKFGFRPDRPHERIYCRFGERFYQDDKYYTIRGLPFEMPTDQTPWEMATSRIVGELLEEAVIIDAEEQEDAELVISKAFKDLANSWKLHKNNKGV